MDSPLTVLQKKHLFFFLETQRAMRQKTKSINLDVLLLQSAGIFPSKVRVMISLDGIVRFAPINGNIYCKHQKTCLKCDQQSPAVGMAVPIRWPWYEHSSNQAPHALISMFHYALTCMGMNDCTCARTHSHTQTDSALCGSVSISLPHCESLAIPDAGWSAEPGWPETISDPRGGRTLQWALRPWLKHQPLSMQRWRPDRKGGKKGRSQKRWRSPEFSCICCLYSWLKGRFCLLFYELGSPLLLPNTHVSARGRKAESGFPVGTLTAWDGPILT